MLRVNKAEISISENRFESIDILRGIASIMVCLFHFSNGIPDFLPDTNLLKIAGSWGHLGVEIFFIISGFIIPFSLFKSNYSIKSLHIFFYKRIIRIEPPYLISILLAIILKFISSLAPMYRGAPFDIDFSAVLLHIGYLCAFFKTDWILPVYWTLAIEFQFYFLIAFTYSFFICNRKDYVFYLYLVLVNIPALSGFTDKAYILPFMPYFSLGIIMFRMFALKKSNIEFYILSFFLLLTILFSYGLAPWVVCVFTLLVILSIKKSSSVFIFLGKISFSLYLTHVLFGTRILNLSINYTDNFTIRTILIFVAIGISIFAAYIYYLLIEKPFLTIANRMKYKV